MEPQTGIWIQQAWGEDSGTSDTGGSEDATLLKLKDLAHRNPETTSQKIIPQVLTRFFVADSLMRFLSFLALLRRSCRLTEVSRRMRPYEIGGNILAALGQRPA